MLAFARGIVELRQTVLTVDPKSSSPPGDTVRADLSLWRKFDYARDTSPLALLGSFLRHSIG